MRAVVYLYVRTGPKRGALPYRHTMLLQDVVFLNEYAALGLALPRASNLCSRTGAKNISGGVSFLFHSPTSHSYAFYEAVRPRDGATLWDEKSIPLLSFYDHPAVTPNMQLVGVLLLGVEPACPRMIVALAE